MFGKIDVKKYGFESQKASTDTAPLTEVTSPESVFFIKFAFMVFFTCFPPENPLLQGWEARENQDSGASFQY